MKNNIWTSFQRDFQMSTWLHSRLCVYWF